MTRKIFYLLTAAIMLASCSKEQATVEPTAPKYPVSYNLSSFATTVTDMDKAGGAMNRMAVKHLSDMPDVHYLDYLVYDANGTQLVHQKRYSRNTLTAFGEITDTLPVGRYTVCFIGSLVQPTLPAVGYATTEPFCTIQAGNINSGLLYSQKMEIEVVAPVTRGNSFDVLLQRMSGLIQVHIEDASAQPAGSQVFTTFDIQHGLEFNLFSQDASYRGSHLVNFITDNPAEGINCYALGAAPTWIVTGRATIGWKDANGIVRKTKWASFYVERSKITHISGRLFDDEPVGFSVKAEDEWVGSTEVRF